MAEYYERPMSDWYNDPPEDSFSEEVHNEIELWEQWTGLDVHPERTARAARRKLEKWVYKGTICGASIVFEPDHIVVGSIVEGVEQTTEYYQLYYPFDIRKFNSALDSIEEEALEIWNETHGCEECGDEDQETGYRRVRDDCSVCQGQGVAI